MLIVSKTDSTGPPVAGTRIIVIAVPIILFGILYWGILLDWGQAFLIDPTYSHGFIVPLITAYLVYTKLSGNSPAVTDQDRRADLFGFAVLISGCLLLIAGERATITFIVRLSFLVGIAGIVLVLFGRRTMRAMAFPYLFLFFALPLPALVYLPLSFRMQLLSTRLSGWALDMLGIPALREGNIIILPNVSLQVVEACSGVHSIFSLLAVATLAGYLFLRGFAPRLLLALTAVPLAVGLNAMRVTLLGVLSYMASPEAAEGLTHDSVGVALFATGCGAVLAIGAALARLKGRREENAAVRPLASAFVAQPAFGVRTLCVSCILLLAMIGFARSNHPGQMASLRAPWSNFPVDLGEWHGRDLPISRAELDSLGTSSVLLRQYTRNGGGVPVTLYVAFLPAQHEGTTLHSPLHCIPGAGWETGRQEVLPIRTGSDDVSFYANEVVFRKADDRILVLYWYMQQGRVEVSELRGALRTLLDSSAGGRTDGCLIRFSSPVTTTTAALNEQLALLHRALPILTERFLPEPPSLMSTLTARRQ